MRCPKCGFISFDHLTSCAKCKRDVSELAVELQGTSIKSELPMFLSGALGAFSAEEEETFEEQALDTEMEEGIDFDMEMEGEEEVAGADIDFSFEDEGEEQADISLAEAEAVEDVDFDLGVGAEEVEISEEEKTDALAAEAEEIEEAEEGAATGFEELDLSGTDAEGEEGCLEFDLEDFIESDD